MFKMDKIVCASILLYFVSVRQISAHGHHPPEENVEKTGNSTLTKYQQAQLEKFRNVAADVLDDDYERSDEYLLGFLKSRKWEIFSAEQMLKMAKIWKERPIHNMKELANSNFSQEMLTYFPVKLDGYDKMGCPLTQVYFGSWNVADYISKQEYVRDGISTVVRMITDYANYAPSVMLATNLVEVPDTIKPLLELLRTNLNEELYGLFKVHEEEKWQHDLYNLVEGNQLGRKLGGTADDI